MKKITVILITIMGTIFLECTNAVNDSPTNYTVTYHGNGNTGGNVPIDVNTYKAGDTVTVLDNIGNLVRTGFTFSGWKTAANNSGINYSSSAKFIMGDSDIILYAEWTVVDIDGNIYHTVTIGSQIWTVENLRTTRYNDGSAIPHVTPNFLWDDLTPGYCYFNNTTDADSIKVFGALYNWYVIETGKLAPAGWHVPTDEEWTQLEKYLVLNGYNFDGTTDTAVYDRIGKALAAKTYWWDSTDNIGAVGNDISLNNSTGFSALPAGCRYFTGIFLIPGNEGFWWSATEYDASNAFYRYLTYLSSSLDGIYDNKNWGFSVRLLKDNY